MLYSVHICTYSVEEVYYNIAPKLNRNYAVYREERLRAYLWCSIKRANSCGTSSRAQNDAHNINMGL